MRTSRASWPAYRTALALSSSPATRYMLGVVAAMIGLRLVSDSASLMLGIHRSGAAPRVRRRREAARAARLPAPGPAGVGRLDPWPPRTHLFSPLPPGSASRRWRTAAAAPARSRPESSRPL